MELADDDSRCPGGHSGDSAGRRPAGGAAGVHGAFRLHGTDLPCWLADLCEEGGPLPAEKRGCHHLHAG